MSGAIIGNSVVRVLQLAFAAAVLGVAVVLANDFNTAKDACEEYPAYCSDFDPSLFNPYITALNYAAFTGAFGLLEALAGLALLAVSAAAGFTAALVLDGLAAVFYLAGGILWAVRFNQLTGGYRCEGEACSRAQAVLAFEWLGFVFALFGLGIVAFTGRSGGRSSAV